MKSLTRLVRRGSKYYFRARIPTDLLAAYAPRREISLSLKTRDKQEALELVRLQSVKLDAEFAAKRANLRAKGGPSIKELTQQDIEWFVAHWLHRPLKSDEQQRIDGSKAMMYERDIEYFQKEAKLLREGIARGDTSVIAAPLEDWLLGHNVELAQGSETYKRLAWALLKASAVTVEKINRRFQGEPVDTPEAPPATLPSRASKTTSSTSSSETLSGLFEYWKGQRERNTRTLLEFKTAVDRFNKLNGEMPAAAIEKAHLVKFKDALIERGLARATIVKQLGALRAVFQLAVDNDKLKTNPASRVRVPKGKTQERARLPYSPADLNAIFQCPIFTHGKRPQAGCKEAAYWLPLLALFTGARVGELGQLHPTDIKELDGIRYLEITDTGDEDGGQRSIKTESSRRRVPIHPELIACGFLGYVQEMRAKKAK